MAKVSLPLWDEDLTLIFSYRLEAEFTGRTAALEYKTKCKELIGKKLMQVKAKKMPLINNKFRNWTLVT